ncbi:hypothetical protein Tco_1376053 [Tanacetum coccineum]
MWNELANLCQGGGRGNETNGSVDGVPDFSMLIAQQLQDLLPTIIAQVGNHVNNPGNNEDQNGNDIDDNIQGDIRNVNVTTVDMELFITRSFWHLNPRSYDVKVFLVPMMYLRESSFQNIQPQRFLRLGSQSNVGCKKSCQSSEYRSNLGQITRCTCHGKALGNPEILLVVEKLLLESFGKLSKGELNGAKIERSG